MTAHTASLSEPSAVLGRLTRWLLWSNVAIALSAAGWVVLTSRALGAPVDPAMLALSFFLGMATYTHDRVGQAQRRRDRESMPARTAWIERHLGVLRGASWLGFAGAAVMVAIRPEAYPPILGGLGFTLLYAVPWIPLGPRRVSFKDLPGIKMPYVGILFACQGVLAPAAAIGRLSDPVAWEVALVTSLLVMTQILANDLRDRETDARYGTLSLPVLIGERRARLVGLALAASAALLADGAILVPVLGAALYSAATLVFYDRRRDARWRPVIELQGLVPALLCLA